MKNRYFLLSALAAAAIMPGTASANLVLDIPPILAGGGSTSTACTSDSECYSGNGVCCNSKCYSSGFCCNGQICSTSCDVNGDCPAPEGGKLNDTGIITKQADDDDSQYGLDKTNGADNTDGHAGFSFTKLDDSGNTLAASATSWECVQDNVTGLIWSKDQGPAMNLTGVETKKNTANSGNGLCGKTGWRTPNLKELLSLVSYDVATGKMIDSTFFSDTQAAAASSSSVLWYWTSSSNGTTNKWGVSFQPQYTVNSTAQYVQSTTNTLNGSHYLRLVYGDEKADNFTASGDSVTDANTGLIWKRCLEGQTWSGTDCTSTATLYTWGNALGGLTANGWRLPNIKELQSSASYFISQGSAAGYVWSASPHAGNVNNIWVFNAADGTFFNGMPKTTTAGYVRLVKDVQ